jgi:hypothetical protein
MPDDGHLRAVDSVRRIEQSPTRPRSTRSSSLACASDVAPNVYGAIVALGLAGIGLIGWLLPDRPIWGFTGGRRSTCAIFCLVCCVFAVLAILGVPIGRG